jgi:hypothetical protein
MTTLGTNWLQKGGMMVVFAEWASVGPSGK